MPLCCDEEICALADIMAEVNNRKGLVMSASVTLANPAAARPVNQTMVWWFSGVHAMAVVAVVYLIAVRCETATVMLAVGMFYACHLSITMGPHRLYAHGAYEASWVLEVLLLILSAATLQSSALWWAVYHQRHHFVTDTERDPYTVLHGFWWAHFWWMLHARKEVPPGGRRLVGNKLLILQHKYYWPLGLLAGLGLPTAIASLWGDPVGGFLVAGFLRLVPQYHLTWSVNSVAHTFGWRRYPNQGTARTNPLLALFTVGETYHERHHLAEGDYRLGNRWYDLDVGKWAVWLCAQIWLARNLNTVSEEIVIAKAHAAAA